MASITRKAGKVYYGWFVVAICMFALMLSVGMTASAFALYIVPASADFGISRATMNTGMILMNAGTAVTALFVGRMIDRFSIRLIMGVSAVALAASLITLGLSENLLLSAAVLSLPVGFAMAGAGSLTAPALVARWFAVHRGRAMAITMMGKALGAIAVVPMIAWLIDVLGWRHSLVAMGCVAGTVLPALTLLVRHGPRDDEHESAGEAARPSTESQSRDQAGSVPLTTFELFRRPLFWAIGLGTALTFAVFQGIMVSLVPIAQGMGYSATMSASLMSALGIAGICGKVGIAWAADRYEKTLMLVGCFALIASGCAVLLASDTYSLLLVTCGLLGFATGSMVPLFLAVLADQFGAQSLGTANGNTTFLIAALGAGAVRFSGEVFDRTGGYELMLYAFILLEFLAVVLMLIVHRSTRPEAPMPAETD